LARNPPSAALLGLPSLESLQLDAAKTAGDPRCPSSPPKRYYYTTSRNLAQLVQWLYPNIRRRTEVDGMNRVWFRNPRSAEQLFLTSGTELTVQTRPGGVIWQIVVTPAASVLPLTEEQQPYSPQDIVEGTPWPGGAGGKREFVRVDSSGTPAGHAPAAQVAPPASAANPTPSPVAAAPATANPAPNCPPNPTGGAANEVAQAVGGALGRSVSGALGGLGSLLGGTAPRPAQAGDCR
jgi:hypothetical protein